MTVPVQDPINQNVIVGGESTLPWTWYLGSADEILVTKQIGGTGTPVEVNLDVGFTIDPNDLDDEDGGDITLIGSEVPVNIGDVWTLSRNSTVNRSENFTKQGDFFAVTINAQLDELTRIDQDRQRDVDAAVHKDPGVGDTLDPLIPQPADRRALVFSDKGGGDFEMVMSEFDPDTTAQDAQDSADAAAQSATDAQTAETGAQAAQTAAELAETNAETAETNAETAETNAAQSAADAAASASAGLYLTVINVTSSPFNVLSSHNGNLLEVDTSGGNIVINLPDSSGLTSDFRIGVVKRTGDTNTAEVTRAGSDTINDAATAISQAEQFKIINYVLDQSDANYIASDISPPGVPFKGVLVAKTLNQGTLSGAPTILTWDDEQYDTDNIHDNSTNPSRLTVPTGVTFVRLVGSCFWIFNSSGFRNVKLFKNGDSSFEGSCQDSNQAAANADIVNNFSSSVLPVSGGDYFEMSVTQGSPGALEVSHNFNTWFALEIIE